MSKLFWLIYIQPLHRIAICMILMVMLWGYIGKKEGKKRWWKILNFVAFAGIVTVIFYMTVYTRGESTEEAVLIPFQSFRAAKIQPELYRSMLMNVFLFFPIGLSLPNALTKWKFPVLITIVVAFFFSTGIEYIQYHYGLGKCEVDDIIMNTLGATIGSLAYMISRKDFFCSSQRT